jgi:hypothetical protein
VGRGFGLGVALGHTAREQGSGASLEASPVRGIWLVG